MTRLHDAAILSPCRLPFLVSRLRIDNRSLGGDSPAAVGQSRFITFLGVHAPPPVPSCKGTNPSLPGKPWPPSWRTAASRALKPTWSPLPAIPSLIRIDYVPAGPAFKPLSAWTLDFPASDHRAVHADIALPPP